jgi:hypothetical protein
MELQLILNDISTKLDISTLEIQKMLFINSALEDGWNVEKSGESYIFKKKHEDKTEYLRDSYLKDFIKEHFNFLK